MIIDALFDVKVSGILSKRHFHRPDCAVCFTVFDKNADGCGDKHPDNSNVLGVVHAFRDEMIGEPIQALYVNANNLGDEGGHGLQITFGGRNWLGHIHAAVGEDRYILQATHSFQRSDLGVPAWELLVWLASLPG